MDVKLALTGMLLTLFLFLAVPMEETKAPVWFKRFMLLIGCTGLAMVFVGALWAIWGSS